MADSNPLFYTKPLWEKLDAQVTVTVIFWLPRHPVF